jgi:hypothetical protein
MSLFRADSVVVCYSNVEAAKQWWRIGGQKGRNLTIPDIKFHAFIPEKNLSCFVSTICSASGVNILSALPFRRFGRKVPATLW